MAADDGPAVKHLNADEPGPGRCLKPGELGSAKPLCPVRREYGVGATSDRIFIECHLGSENAGDEVVRASLLRASSNDYNVGR